MGQHSAGTMGRWAPGRAVATIVKTIGDAFHAAFREATPAAQRALCARTGLDCPIRVRIQRAPVPRATGGDYY